MEGDAGDLFIGSEVAQGVEGAVDFAASGHEDEDVAFVAVVDDLFDGRGGLIAEVAIIGDGEIIDFDGVALAFGNEDGALFQIFGDGFGIEGGGHDEDGQVGAFFLLEVFDQGEGDVAEEVSLVEFIEEDGSDFREGAVVLEPAEEDALGDEDDAGGGGSAVVEADLVTYLGSDFGFAF